MINVVISLYYYLLILKAAYLLEPQEEQPTLQLSQPSTILTGVLVALMVVVGIYPTYLLELATAAAGALM
jgi:NADH-quinone oxidoreductase subunit N